MSAADGEIFADRSVDERVKVAQLVERVERMLQAQNTARAWELLSELRQLLGIKDDVEEVR